MKYAIKKISPLDKERVIEISSKIWKGEDYIPLVFDDWVKQQKSNFVGLWIDGILIAFNRLVYLTPNDVWLEGLRKDLESEHKGVTALLFDYHLKRIKKLRNISSVRFSTYFNNKASVHFHEKVGFVKIKDFSHKYLNINNNVGLKNRILKPFSFTDIFNFINKSDFLRSSEEYFIKNRVVYPFSKNLLLEFYEQDEIIEFRKDGIIKGCAVFCNDKEENSLWICLLEAENEIIFDILLTKIKQIAIERGRRCLQIVLPKTNDLFEKNGFRSRERENDFWLYELDSKLIR